MVNKQTINLELTTSGRVCDLGSQGAYGFLAVLVRHRVLELDNHSKEVRIGQLKD